MEDIKRILVISWMTRCCEKSIYYGMSLAQKYQAELTVAHISNTLWMEGWNLPIVSLIEERKKDLEKIKYELDTVIKMGKKKNISIKELIKEGDPVEEILHTIKDEKIDLLIMRAHEEGRVERFLIGGSNDAIIRKMPCSIFLVKSGLQ